MITDIGQSILDELSSELSEKNEDNKTNTMIEQSANIFKTFIRLAIKFTEFFFAALGLILLFIFAFISEDVVSDFKFATMEDLFNLHETTIFLAFVISFLTTIFISASSFRNVKQEIEQKKKDKILQTKSTIELVEEVLYRHNLIESAGINKT